MTEFILGAILVGLALIFWFVHRARLQREEAERVRKEEELRQRRDGLIAKYKSEKIADAIIAQKVWQGMTSEQLTESWGGAASVDRKIYKTKTNETWKYGQIGKNRFSQKMFIENDVVVGWEQH